MCHFKCVTWSRVSGWPSGAEARLRRDEPNKNRFTCMHYFGTAQRAACGGGCASMPVRRRGCERECVVRQMRQRQTASAGGMRLRGIGRIARQSLILSPACGSFWLPGASDESVTRMCRDIGLPYCTPSAPTGASLPTEQSQRSRERPRRSPGGSLAAPLFHAGWRIHLMRQRPPVGRNTG
jgi:hypothetical protein